MIVKVCGVRTPEIAEVAIDAGADWLGLVLVRDSPRHVDDRAARAVVAAVRGRAALVGVMVDATTGECDEVADRYRLAAVQLHGDVDPSMAAAVSVPVIRAVNTRDAAAVYAEDWWPDCLILLDAAPSSEKGLPGGTGIRVDTTVARAVARHRPLILAGGLDAGNVGEAISQVRPQGVDASSALESSPGVKDAALVDRFVRTARDAAGTP